ncbi:TPA: hypothetical protein ACOEQU_000123 [Stenotrophomonas maltophilia]
MSGNHLWEAPHPYYCNLGNYFNNNCGSSYKSWADFIEEQGNDDMDLNLLFRWDWKEGEDHDLPAFNGDVYYRNGTLELFYMGQRKGLYRYVEVSVCRADEAAIRDWLMPRWEHLKSLWQPLPDATGEAA